MKKLLVTTALSLSLLSVSGSFAADKVGADNKPSYKYEEGRGHSKLLAALPKDKADLFRASMKKVHEKNKELYKQIKGLRGEVSVITKAADFDKKAYIDKNLQIVNLKNTMSANKTEAIADFLTKLSLEERIKFADNMKSIRNGKGKHQKNAVSADKPTPDSTKK